MNKREINQKLIVNYKNHLIDEEKSLATIYGILKNFINMRIKRKLPRN